MNKRMTRQEARILSLVKKELPICTLRRIEAKLETYSGEIIEISMVEPPDLITYNHILVSKLKRRFDDVWYKGQENDLVMLVHFDETGGNYFYRLNSK